MGGLGAGTAAAQPVSLTLKYTCDVPWIEDQHITARIDANLPASVALGQSSKKITIRAGTTVAADITPWIGRIGVKTVEGTVDAKIKVNAPQGDRQIGVPLDITRTNIPASGSFGITATGAVLTPAFTRPGTARITVGDIVLNVVGKKASGEALELPVPCTLDGGQKNFVGSFKITKTGTGSGTDGGSTSSGGTGTNGGSGTDGGTDGDGTTAPGSTPTAASAAGGSAPTGIAANGTGTGTIANTGGDAEDLILPAVGILAAGVAALCLGSRLKNHRRAADG
ncbi:DUF6801 domain-containing protein [Streptomyces sp. NPDC055025]